MNRDFERGTDQPNWDRRPKEDEPVMAQRTFRDEQGRNWTAFVQSGRVEGGEDFAEVLFICSDQPGEMKRVATLDLPPRQADQSWSRMAEDEVVELFRRSEPA